MERLVQEHRQRHRHAVDVGSRDRLAHPDAHPVAGIDEQLQPAGRRRAEEHRPVEAREARVLPRVGDAEDRLPGARRARDAHARGQAQAAAAVEPPRLLAGPRDRRAGRLAGEATRRGRRRHARVGGLGGGRQPDRDRRAHGDVAEPVAHPHGDGVQPRRRAGAPPPGPAPTPPARSSPPRSPPGPPAAAAPPRGRSRGWGRRPCTRSRRSRSARPPDARPGRP